MLFDVYHNDRDINNNNESVSHSQPAIRIMIKELIAVFKIFLLILIPTKYKTFYQPFFIALHFKMFESVY